MKKSVFCVLTGGFLLFLASTTLAVPIGDVGSLDTLFAVGNISSSAQSEADWLNGLLGTSYDNTYVDNNKIQVDSTTWEPVVGGATGQYAFQLPSNEGYFLVKTGNGTYDHWLFQNIDNTNWGTVVVGGVYPLANFDAQDIRSISHIVPAGASVPEPATMLLIGFGLVGLVGFGRKKLKK